MQLAHRYLVKNKTILVSNDTGFVTEYRPVYNRQLKIYKGIDNTLEFRLMNADQKPVNLANYTPRLVAFDENHTQVLDKQGTVLDDGSTITRGLFTVLIGDNDTLNIDGQFLNYTVYLIDDTTNLNTLTYNNVAFDACGTIEVDTCAFPGPKPTYNITTFIQSDTVWLSESIEAQPAINGNEALHTLAVYTNNYIGDIVIQGTLENQVVGTTKWADLDTLTFDGTETTPMPANFNGVFSFLRVKATADPANTITKILVRN
jgi:hypothetical protein